MKNIKQILTIITAVLIVLTLTTLALCDDSELSVSGFLSVDLNFTSTEPASGTSEDTSDIFIYGFGLELSAGLAENVSADIIFLLEEAAGDADIYGTIDVAYLTYQKNMIYGKFGKLYIPFADAGSNFLVDSYTLTLGESRESAIIAGLDAGMINVEVGAFNGDSNEVENGALTNADKVDDFFAAVKVTPVAGDDMEVTIGASYLSDITDQDVSLLGENAGYADLVGGYSAFIVATAKTGTLLVEYVTAADDIDTKVFDDGGTPDDDSDDTLTDAMVKKPSAFNVEIVATFIDDFSFGVKYETTDGDTSLDRVGAMVGYSLSDDASVMLEYLAEEDDANNTIDSITAHLTLGF